MQRARLRHPAIAANASRKFRELRLDRVDVALGQARDLAVRADSHLVQQPLDRRADADDELEIVGRPRRIEQRRWRIALDIDDDLAIARSFAAGVGECAKQRSAIVVERTRVRPR